MKKILAFVIAPFLIFSSCSKSPLEKAGEKSFEVLKRLPQTSIQEFKEYFVSVNDVLDLGASIEDISSEEILEYNNQIEDMYEVLLRKGINYGIEWVNIEYLGFEGEVYNNDGVRGSEGELLFRHAGKIFTVDVLTLDTKNGVKLAEVKWLIEIPN